MSASDAVSGDTYREAYRPRFHFSPPAQWMNDPNGLVYYQGVFHLFYQHHPDSTLWGPMHWGHALSRDLVHWEHQPIALYPDDKGYIFSGSAVLDRRNSSGLGSPGAAPLVAIFTYHDPDPRAGGGMDKESQAIAYSVDGGCSWTKYEGDPVLPNPGGKPDFRDPKVFWHAPSERWLMALAAGDQIEFWNSPDLKQWAYLSSFGADYGAHGGVWECPDLMELPVVGSDRSRWVLLVSINPGGPQGGSATQYFVGDFDGRQFTVDQGCAGPQAEAGAMWLDYGRDNYAGVTWSDVPEEDGRRLFIGWMGNWDYAREVPTANWRGAMTLPRQLTLQETRSGLRVASRPVRELEVLRRDALPPGRQNLSAGGDYPLAGLHASQCELLLRIELPGSGVTDIGIELSNAIGEYYRIGYRSDEDHFYSDRSGAGGANLGEHFATRQIGPRLLAGGTLLMHLFFDCASAELFADDGLTAITDTFFPGQDFSDIRLYVHGSPVTAEISGWNLASIWR